MSGRARLRGRVSWSVFATLSWAAVVVAARLSFFHVGAYLVGMGSLGLYAARVLWRRAPHLSREARLWLASGLVVMGLSVAFSPLPLYSLGWFFLNLLFPLVVGLALSVVPLPMEHLGRALLAVFLVVLVDAGMTWLGDGVAWLGARTWPFQALRFSADRLYASPEATAFLLALGFPLLAVWTGLAAPSRERRLARAVLGLALWGLAWSRSVAAGLAFLVGMAVLWASPARAFLKDVFRPRLLWGPGMLAAVGIFVWNMRLPPGPGSQPLTFPARVALWKLAWQRWQQRPLTGYGPGTWPFLSLEAFSVPPYRIPDSPHNLLADILFSTGALGLVWAGALAVGLGRRLRGMGHGKDPVRFAVLSAGIAWLVYHSLAEMVSWGPWNLFLAPWLLLGERRETRAVASSSTSPLWRGVAWGMLVFLGLHGLALGMYEVGWWQARRYRWLDAARWMGVAARLAPWQPGYTAGTAYAYARASLQTTRREEHRERLQAAHAWYQRLLARDPRYALHWANEAWVLWMLEAPLDAVDAMQQAVARAPQGPYLFALAWIQERRGYTDVVQILLPRYLTLYPWRSLSPELTRTPARKRALELWKRQEQPSWWFRWGEPLYRAMLSARPEQMQQVWVKQADVMPAYARAYTRLAIAALQGDRAAARLFRRLRSLWPDMHLWLQAHMEAQVHPERKKERFRPALLRFLVSSSFGEDWEVAEDVYSTLYRVLPPPRSDLIPGFPRAVSPALQAGVAWLRQK